LELSDYYLLRLSEIVALAKQGSYEKPLLAIGCSTCLSRLAALEVK
jgi:hypothetical protein